MRDRVARLRIWLAGSALLLLTVIAGFIGYGRYVSHLQHLKLPLPPGVNIVREAGGWTYSRANGSRTLYTIHAAGFQQGKNGKTTLHDVSLVLFGKDGDRNDRVSGQDFEYDEKNGVLRALGQVHIDLQSAAAAKAVGQLGQTSVAEGPHGKESLGPDAIHVTTSGLVYLEKLGIAATSEDVDIQSGDLKGHARGADYSSDSGVLMLHSAVEMAGVSAGHPVRMTAEQAQFNQRDQQARLTHATYATEGRSIAADTAVLYRRPDGKLGRLEAEGNVVLKAADGKATGRQLDLQMDAAGQPALATLSGNVVYAGDEPPRQVRAEAAKVEVSFSKAAAGRAPDHAVFSGAVRMMERVRTEQQGARWSSRELTGGKVETWMTEGPGGRMLLRNAVSTGNARLVESEDPAGLKPDAAVRTELAADELKAVMKPAGNSTSVDRVLGKGNTIWRQVTAAGAEQTSMGETLEASFRPADRVVAKGKSGAADGLQSTGEIEDAVQEGHVTMTRRLPGKRKGEAEEVQHATADRVAYNGGSDQLVLSGGVRMNDASGAMWAQQVSIERSSGDAHAAGPVKAEYVQQAGSGDAGSEPMHILAQRAEVRKGNDSAIFYGSPVRVWEGGNQVQAPEVQVERANKRMTARSGGARSVRTFLVGVDNGANGVQTGGGGGVSGCGTANAATARKSAGRQRAGNAVRISSGELVYSGALHQVEFTGGVRAEMTDETVQAAQATAFLGKQNGKSAGPGLLEGGVERIVADGAVVLTRPGTRVSGEHLLYQAAERSFVLKGGEQPARAVDARGSTTAASFHFSACDNTLQALGEEPGTRSRKVETESTATGAKREKASR